MRQLTFSLDLRSFKSLLGMLIYKDKCGKRQNSALKSISTVKQLKNIYLLPSPEVRLSYMID